MRKTVLYIAMSLDGYIADRNGGVGWMGGQDQDVENEDTYTEFVKDVDTIIMGWTTYEQVTTQLSPSEWVYQDFTSYVVTHRQMHSTEKIRFVHEDPVRLVAGLKEESGKYIWICGGASIVQQLMQAGLIDRLYISVIPTVLGGGIRLFGAQDEELKLKLIGTKSYNGIVELVYERR